VQLFQQDHGLTPDGVVGPGTMAEINKPMQYRLQSVIVAMERERWNNQDRGKRHVLVNLTDFSARIIDNDNVTFETRAVVGKNAYDRQSPEFSDVMEFMVINPTWNVPRSIAVKEYLPMMQRNPNAVGHLKLYNGRGQVVDRSNVNFAALTANNFPFDIKQPPSRRNALGLVKFMFPNKYNIYLHDTPEKSLFTREKRDFSHGCIRLQQPFEFAYTLLSRQEKDPQSFFKARLDTGRETVVPLEQPVPVHIIYRTAFTRANGHIQYRRDVYGRDAKIWKALVKAGVSRNAVQG
jgi:murein L,D-transpeptidase YcbB/YkuD